MAENIECKCGRSPTGFCIGCLRTGQEIAMWSQIDNKQVRHVLKEIKNRAIFKNSSN